jgi:Ca2+/H+ antiporter
VSTCSTSTSRCALQGFNLLYGHSAKLIDADTTRQLKSHASLFEADAQAARTNENGEVEEEEKPEMDAYSAFGWLALVTVATAVCADVLVASIDETAAEWNLPKA